MSACTKIRHIIRIRHMLRQWRRKASIRAAAPRDVPAGHVAVAVGSNRRRFVVRAVYLNHPVFRKLLVEAEEYGFTNTAGPLVIPCDESLFEEVLRLLEPGPARPDDLLRRCYCGGAGDGAESRPLLYGISDESVYLVAE